MRSGEEGWAGGRSGGVETLEEDQAGPLDNHTINIYVGQGIFGGVAEEATGDSRNRKVVLVAHAARGG